MATVKTATCLVNDPLQAFPSPSTKILASDDLTTKHIPLPGRPCLSAKKTLIFDFGDVLFTWSPSTKTSISPKLLKKILSTKIWSDYECGRISEATCYQQAARKFVIPVAEVAEAFSQARGSLKANSEMIAAINELKQAHGEELRVFAMSNISKEDYEVLSSKEVDWSIFERVFTSGHAGMRKPDLGFYRYVLDETKTLAQDAVFVDDKFENVFSARSLGMTGIVFDNTSNVIRTLRNLCDDPVKRGWQYLRINAKKMHSVIENGMVIRDNFAQLLILESTHEHSLVDIKRHPRTWNYFIGKPVLTSEKYPDDLDTTSLALSNIEEDPKIIGSVLNEMLKHLDEDGIVQTYFDKDRPRIDPVVCANVLSLFYRYGRGNDLRGTLQWVQDVIRHRAYMDGTRYYTSADVCLFFFGRLLKSSDDLALHEMLWVPLKDRTRERIGASGDPLQLAMRLLTCQVFGLRNEVDMRALLDMQQEDGGWNAGWLCKYGSSNLRIGNRGVTTAMAVNAIEAASR